MKTHVRKATVADLDAIECIYDRIHTQEEQGPVTTGWRRGIYPVRSTAEAGLARDDLFVLEADGEVAAAAIINQQQVDVYKEADWRYEARDEDVMVLHTLVVDPCRKGCGLGRIFVRFYEQYALENGCTMLRLDTNVLNLPARAFYKKQGYEERGVVTCVFNNMDNIRLVLLEKCLKN